MIKPNTTRLTSSGCSINKLKSMDAPTDIKNKPKFSDYFDFVQKLRKENLDLAISIGRSPLVPILLSLSGAKHTVGYATNFLKFLYSKSVPLNQNQYAAKMYFEYFMKELLLRIKQFD